MSAPCIGPDAKIDPMQAAPLRLGGVPRSYGPHCLVVGDAAGQIDPLTGEGIQYGMDAAEIAAATLDEAFRAGDWSEGRLRAYQEEWLSLVRPRFSLVADHGAGMRPLPRPPRCLGRGRADAGAPSSSACGPRS